MVRAGDPLAPSVAMSSTAELTTAIRTARSITLGAYILHDGPLVDALEGAADAEARVKVRLGVPFHDAHGALRRSNDRVVRELRAHGVDAAVVKAGLFHLKAAVVDGRAYLDDRNWNLHGDTVLADALPADVAAVREALDGVPGASAPDLATEKGGALDLERDVIVQSKHGVDIQTETLAGGPMTHAMRVAAQNEHVRLIVSPDEVRGHREHAALVALAQDGVDVRIGARGAGNEKLCVADDAAWAGSANATWALAGTADWGLRTQQPDMVAALRDRFEHNWALARSFVE